MYSRGKSPWSRICSVFQPNIAVMLANETPFTKRVHHATHQCGFL